MEITNAKITNVTLTMADHGVLTFYLTIEGNGVGFNYGGFVLGHGYLGAKEFEGGAKGLESMMRIMDVVGVERWEDLQNKYIRYVDNGWGQTVKKIGNIINDNWFDITEFFSAD